MTPRLNYTIELLTPYKNGYLGHTIAKTGSLPDALAIVQMFKSRDGGKYAIYQRGEFAAVYSTDSENEATP